MAYIDGLNLFHGLRSQRLQRVMWLDMQVLAENLLKPDQELVRAHYVTSRVIGASATDSPDWARRKDEKKARQTALLRALQTRPKLTLHFGRFQDEPVRCPHCLGSWIQPVEKKTDVWLATLMLRDFYTDACDEFLLVSADSDLVPPVTTIQEGGRRVVVAFPPGRDSAELRSIAAGYFTIGIPNLNRSRLPNRVALGNGRFAERPTKWIH